MTPVTPARGLSLLGSSSPRARRVLKWTAWTCGIVIAVGILGALVAPPLVRSALEQRLSQTLHRKVSIERLRINPYALSLTVGGLRVSEADSDRAALTLERLYATRARSSRRGGL